MINNTIEIIFEECGWVFDPTDSSWSLANFKVSRTRLHKVLKQGNGRKLRDDMVKKFSTACENEKLKPDERNCLGATIERLKIKRKR